MSLSQIFLLAFLGGVLGQNSDCEIYVRDPFPANQPLILSAAAQTNTFLLPNDVSGKIILKKDETIKLACSDDFEKAGKTRTVQCVEGNKFKETDITYEFKDFNCKTKPEHSAKKSTTKCFNDATVIEVGFDIDGTFYKSFEICFDEALERTYYVKHEFTPGYKQFQTPTDDKWTNKGFFKDRNVDELYTGVKQKATIAKILNSQAYADLYINLDKESVRKDFFLSRGHLAARTDFVFANNQRATYYFMNAAPQWQIFNGGNWNAIEIGIKDFVADKNLEVDVYTGTYGTTTLLDEKNKAHEIFLDFDANNNGLIPVPKIYYKVLVERKTQNGIVLIGVNNPYLYYLDLLKEYIFCKDVSDNIKWLDQYIKWQRTNITLGYSYACDVNEFMKFVKYLPDLKVTGLLNSASNIYLHSSLLVTLIFIIFNHLSG